MKQVFFAFFCLLSTHLFAQIIEKQNLSYKSGLYDVITLRVDSTLSKRLSILDNSGSKSEKAIFDSLSQQGLYFAITAGIVDSVCNLLGLQIQDGVLVRDVNNSSGSGNFFLEPNGILGSTPSGFEIKRTADYSSKEGYSFAVQSGPLLLNDGAIHPQFNKTSKNKNLRTGIGLGSDSLGQYLVFAISNLPVIFYEFAEFFQQKLKCKDALSLESGSNTSAHFPSLKRTASTKKNICKYIYIPMK
jgi:uncharacterized protein YigE (DUF2233 family)